jgi:transcriptional regulator with XRE-family HTH domain
MGRRPRILSPTLSEAHRLGAELRHWRTEHGMTQDRLGEALHHSAALIGKIEKADRRAGLDLCRRADEVLDTGGALSLRWRAMAAAEVDGGLGSPRRGPERDGGVVGAALPALRRVLDSFDLPSDGPTRPTHEIARDVERMTEHRLQARYGDLARPLPGLIAEVARAGQAGGGQDRRETARSATLLLRAADGMAFKFGHLDLSARIIDLMRATTLVAEDPLLSAAASYVRTETFFASGDLDTAAHTLITAADEVPLDVSGARSHAAFGALHMRAAVVAGRAGRSGAAAEHLREARRAARTVPEGVYDGTAFGPASLRVHELAVAAELRDPAGIERAACWHPPDSLPAERRSHYYIDLARAELDLGHQDDAHRCLRSARQAAPQHAREHPQVRATLSALLRAQRNPSSGLIKLATWARAG